MNTANKTIFIVDDNADFSMSLAWMLRGEGYNSIEFSDPDKAITALRLASEQNLTDSCLLLDIRMPNKTGLEVHDELSGASINIPVVYMTGHADVPLAVEVMQKGAVTILEKPFNESKLMDVLEQVFQNPAQQTAPAASTHANTAGSGLVPTASTQLPNTVLSERSQQEIDAFTSLLDTLTKRENEVLDLIVAGKSNKIAAHHLGISIRTVEVHRARLMKKLNTRSAPELVRKVYEHRTERALTPIGNMTSDSVA